MTDSVERELHSLDAERPLPPSLYERLEHALLADAGARSGAGVDEFETDGLFGDLDAPRPLPDATRAALETELISTRQKDERRGRALLAIAAAFLLVVGTVAALRAGGSPSTRQVAARPTLSVPEAGTLPVLQAPTTMAPRAEAGAAGRGSAPTPTTPRRSATTTTWDCGLCSRNGASEAGLAAASPAPSTTAPGQPETTSVAAASLREQRVDRVDPSSGPRAGGTIVTLTGTGFTGASGVLFGSSSAVNFTVVSDTEIRVMAPPSHKAQTVPVAVTYPDGTSTPTSDSGPFFTYV